VVIPNLRYGQTIGEDYARPTGYISCSGLFLYHLRFWHVFVLIKLKSKKMYIGLGTIVLIIVLYLIFRRR
jgi:hypothetical protein